MGRRKSGSAFSLFSFQDIITSVTAILILVMLLLAVELTQKRQAKAAADPNVTRRRLEKVAQDLEASAARLRQDVVTAQSAESSCTTRELLELQLKQATELLDRARLQRDDAGQALRVAEQARRDAEARLAEREAVREQLQTLAARVTEDRAEADRLELANATERERQAQRRQELEDRPRTGTQLVFNRPADSSQRPWLVELSADGVVVIMLGASARETFGPSAVADGPFDAWVGRLQPGGDYCLLLVRPSADAPLLDDVESSLQQSGIQYGIDFIGEDQIVRDGSADAAATGG